MEKPQSKKEIMAATALTGFPVGNNENQWRDKLFEFLNNRVDEILQQIPMEKIEDFTGAIFKNKSEIL